MYFPTPLMDGEEEAKREGENIAVNVELVAPQRPGPIRAQWGGRVAGATLGLVNGQRKVCRHLVQERIALCILNPCSFFTGI